uniref:Uncharacterized protein n=1 Tax=Manihot esculenta TaxID=3983 RepID=A0A2C9UIA9_MANES
MTATILTPTPPFPTSTSIPNVVGGGGRGGNESIIATFLCKALLIEYSQRRRRWRQRVYHCHVSL